jgi:hypothetical protein
MQGKNNSEEDIALYSLSFFLGSRWSVFGQISLLLAKCSVKLTPKAKKRLGTSRVEPYPARVLQILDLSECEL